MSFIVNAAPIDFNNEEDSSLLNETENGTNPNAVLRKKIMKNKTIKRNNNNNNEFNEENTKRVESIMKALHSRKNHNQSLGNFPKTESAKLINQDMYSDSQNELYPEYNSTLLEKPDTIKQKSCKNNVENVENVDSDVNIEGYHNMNGNNNTSDYVSQYLPYYNNVANSNKIMNENEIYKKLDYLIHLVEEMKDEKTSNVTEELVLYSFLGVFIIFVVDSFARAGKYAR
jgi:hypothetical protein